MNSTAAEIAFWAFMGLFFASSLTLVILGIIDITMEQLGKKKKRKKDDGKPLEMPIPKHMEDKLEKNGKKKKK